MDRRRVRSPTACQVIDRLTGGGQERVAADLARGLDAAGLAKSGLLATRGGGDYERMLDGTPVAVKIVERRSRYDLLGWARVTRWLWRERFDVLHTHSAGSLRAAAGIRRLPGVDFRLVMHLQMLPPEGTGFREEAIDWQARCEPLVDAAIVTNRALVDHLTSLGYDEGKVHRIPNPVDFSSWVAKNGDGGSSGEVDELVLIMVAQWREQKDHETAIRATALLRDRGRRVKLRLVGEEDPALTGPARRLATELGIADSVDFMGRRTDVRELLLSSDIGLLATHFEGLPVAAIEYAASGLPAVLSEVEGTEELISPANGILGARPADPHALAESLEELLGADRGALGRKARKHVESFADEAVVIDRLVSVYENLMEAGPRRPGSR